jgi:AcrR family transcriptional regulator
MARRTKEEALETREQLLDAAERVFLERGVGHATLAEVADAAGVTRGAVYHHFAIGRLFEAMVARQCRWTRPEYRWIRRPALRVGLASALQLASCRASWVFEVVFLRCSTPTNWRRRNAVFKREQCLDLCRGLLDKAVRTPSCRRYRYAAAAFLYALSEA